MLLALKVARSSLQFNIRLEIRDALGGEYLMDIRWVKKE